MGFNRLSKRRLDQVMGRDKKIQKTEKAETIDKDRKNVNHKLQVAISSQKTTRVVMIKKLVVLRCVIQKT